MNHTEKLYDLDAYLSSFEATVLAVDERADGTYAVVLDKTAFFPNEGGQSSDRGTLAGIAVVDVKLKDGVITHITTAPLGVGSTVRGVVDFDERFEKMQCHTAEHIVSGIIYRLFGFDNVGFHLGEFDVIFDCNGVLTREDLDKIEDMANRVVTDDIPVTTAYPSSEKLAEMSYRSKLDLTDGVRIVTIGDVDTCACCAPHVSSTGQIGQIRLLEFEKHRGGTRMRLLAGRRALLEGRRIFKENYRVATALSVTQYETFSAVEKLEREISALKFKLKEQTKREMVREAMHFTPKTKHCVLVFSDVDMDALRAFANAAVAKCEGVLALIVDEGERRNILLASKKIPLKTVLPILRDALAFRGGGSDEMMSGSLVCSIEEILAFFETLN